MSEEKDKKPKANEADLDKLKAELEKSKSDYLYLLADFDNYRKNAIKERSDLLKFGSEKLVREFLGVLDNFERALSAEENGSGSFRDGVQMIAADLKALLQRYGVEEVKSEGEPFDPTKHEALSSEPSTELPPGHVVRVFKKAYKMHDKLIRPAQVTVATAAPQQAN